jgi:sugar (pentulose or hexulose) kinase
VPARSTIVIDIGKTISKATLWAADGTLIKRRSQPNAVLDGVLDANGIQRWLAEVMAEFATLAYVGAIIPVAHGAAAALIAGGKLVCPPRDYEAPIPVGIRDAYDKLRAPFAETGSPALPDGLNLGAQLFAQFHCQWERREPKATESQPIQSRGPLDCRAPLAVTVDAILLWPQYWSWLLSGIASSEVTSLGCHTDLWNPSMGKLSGLVDAVGWTERLPPLRHAGDALGPITPEWSALAGLPSDTNIYCGVHDSNAALVAARGFPEIAGREATVLSTGTWFVAMRSPTVLASNDEFFSTLPETRDCLVNVDIAGQPVPSARFMGGREIELLGEKIDQPGLDGLPELIASRAMILPTFVPGCGPFPAREGQWIRKPVGPAQRRAAIALYAALVTDTALDLIGSREVLLIEGRFARSEAFVRSLATLRPGTEVFVANGEADVSFGGLRLVHPSIRPTQQLTRVAPLALDLTAYKVDWHQRIKEGKEA